MVKIYHAIDDYSDYFYLGDNDYYGLYLDGFYWLILDGSRIKEIIKKIEGC